MADMEALRALAFELGRELLRRGWWTRLAPLRKYLLALREGRIVTLTYTPEFLHRLASVVGLGPTPLPQGLQCPRCSPAEAGAWSGQRTSVYVETLWVSVCSECGAGWVQEQTPPTLMAPSPPLFSSIHSPQT